MAQSFEMLIKSDENASVFDDKLVSSIDGNSRTGWVFTWYVRLADMNVLSVAQTSEVREKRCVCRKVNDSGVSVTQYVNQVNEYGYYLETTLEQSKHQAVEVVNTPITKACYQHLSLIGECAYPFERKRMEAADNGLFYEVDVFLTNGGAKHPWVKVTLFTHDLTLEVPKMPFKGVEYIIDIPGEFSEADKKFVKELWEYQYFHKQPQWIGAKTKLDYGIKRLD